MPQAAVPVGTLAVQGCECGLRLLMNHSLLYRRAALMLVRTAHRTAVDMTVRDITVV